MRLLFFILCIFALSINNLHADDKIIANVKMPNRLIPQCEIQLVETEHSAIIRTIIDSGFPDKVLKKIVTTEKGNWKEHTDMQTYVRELTSAITEYKKRKNEDQNEPLIIDFIASDAGDKIVFYFEQNEWKTLKLSSEYIRKNQEYILIDVFGKKAQEHIEKLKELRNE